MKKPELLAPAGNMEKMRMAYNYGADAVYLGLDKFNLREKADNFTYERLEKALKYAKSLNKKLYVTLNILPKNKDLNEIAKVLDELNNIKPDAVIIADIGLIGMAKKHASNVDIHVSTQANIMNVESAKTFCQMGAKRLILARELSLKEVKEIKEAVGNEHEIEVFVHGSMCVSYSGRCLLSSYMASRDANYGDCAQPCRWRYALVEEKRPGKYYPIYEDEKGTYILNSKDLKMIDYMEELYNSKIDSFKIEGRMKSVFYVASVTKAYRDAIDDYYQSSDLYKDKLDYYNELVSMASHRQYTSAYGIEDDLDMTEKTQNTMHYGTSSYTRDYLYAGLVLDYDHEKGLAFIHEANPVFLGDDIILMSPKKGKYIQKVTFLADEEMTPIEQAHHPAMKYYMKTDYPLEKDTILIKEVAK